MKKFKFSLDSVLSYKQQVLDSLKGEHAAILAQVREQEDVLEGVWQDYRDCNEEYRQRKLEGITVADAMFYQNGLRPGPASARSGDQAGPSPGLWGNSVQFGACAVWK